MICDLQEFEAGHIKGALNLDSAAFSNSGQVDKLIEQLQAKSQVGDLPAWSGCVGGGTMDHVKCGVHRSQGAFDFVSKPTVTLKRKCAWLATDMLASTYTC